LDEVRFLEAVPQGEPAPLNAVVRVPRRDELLQALEREGIEAKIHYDVPIHLLPEYKALGYRSGDFPVAEASAKALLSLPNFPEMIDEQIGRVTAAVRAFFRSD
jgi:dTDP-4-amino-4,6-dideoxygalactose transaminase